MLVGVGTLLGRLGPNGSGVAAEPTVDDAGLVCGLPDYRPCPPTLPPEKILSDEELRARVVQFGEDGLGEVIFEPTFGEALGPGVLQQGGGGAATLDKHSGFRTMNQWTLLEGDLQTIVYAGVLATDYEQIYAAEKTRDCSSWPQGAVRVVLFHVDKYGAGFVSGTLVQASAPNGPLHIVAAEGHVLTMTDDVGGKLWFDVDKKAFVDGP